MQITSHFTDIKSLIIKDLRSAKESIEIAVAWFTDQDIFNVLIRKLSSDVDIKLVILNDDINIRDFSLDFQRFILKGGKFWLANTEHPMHHKFCLIDNRVLITGSYNYTYLANSINHENVLRVQGDCDIINEYHGEFERIVSLYPPIQSLKDYIMSHPPKVNYYSFGNFRLNDMNQHALELRDAGKTMTAQKVYSEIQSHGKLENKVDDFEINDVVYRHWQKDYYVDKVKVTSANIILSFRTESDTDGCWIAGIDVPTCWILEDVHTQVTLKPSAIENVRVNGKLVLRKLCAKTVYAFGNVKEPPEEMLLVKTKEEGLYRATTGEIVRLIHLSSSSKGSLKVDIVFNKDNEWHNKRVNLLEGFETRDKENFWHCFDIDLTLNRIPCY